MKKLLVLCLIILVNSTTCFGWGFWDRTNAKSTSTNKDVEVESTGRGYVGKLPNISKKFKSNDQTTRKPIYEESKDFNSSEEIKPIPRNDPSFVNIILKEDKLSPYLNDINSDVIPLLENILLCIEKKFDVQRFNAKVFYLNKTVEYLHNKYANKPEINYTSFRKLEELNAHAKAVATLREEAEKYRPYLAYSGSGYLYNENVINQQLDYLKTEVEDTIAILKDAK